jgi:hypothetical protein
VDPSVPESVDRICQKALAYDPAERYATAADFRGALETFLGESAVEARRQLGPVVRKLFAAERAKLRALIERAGISEERSESARAMAAAARADDSNAPFVVAFGGSQEARPEDKTLVDDAVSTRVFGDRAAGPAPATMRAPVPAPRRLRIAGTFGAGVAIACALALGVATFVRMSPASSSATRAAVSRATTPVAGASVHAAFSSRWLTRAPAEAAPAPEPPAPAASTKVPAPVRTHRSKHASPAPHPRQNARRAPARIAPSGAASDLRLDSTDPWTEPGRKIVE